MRSRGADKVTRREFIQYARQVAAEYQYLKLTDQLDQAIVGVVTVNTEPKPTHHNCTQTSYSIYTAINSVPSRYDAAIQTPRVEQQNKSTIVTSTKATKTSDKKKEPKQERSYLYTYQPSPDQSEESLPITRHADDELSDSSEDYTTQQHMEEQYFKFMTHATQMAFESMNEMYLMGISKSKTMAQMKNKLQPADSINDSHLYNTKGPSAFTSFDNIRPIDTTIIDGENWSEVKDGTSKNICEKHHSSTKANYTGTASTATTIAAATCGNLSRHITATPTTDTTLLENHATTTDQMPKSLEPTPEVNKTEPIGNERVQEDIQNPPNTYNPSPFTSFDSLPRSETNDKTNANASRQTSRTSSRQTTSKRASRQTATNTTAGVAATTAVAAATAAAATAAGVAAATGNVTGVSAAAAMPSVANQVRMAEQTQSLAPASNATDAPSNKPKLVRESLKPHLLEDDPRKMTITSEALFSDGVDGLNEHTNIVQISSHVMRSMMSETKSEGLMSGGDFLLDENDTHVIDKLIDESSQLCNETILDSMNSDEEKQLLAARYGNESMTETISSIVKSVSMISQKCLGNRESTLISVSDISNNENRNISETLENINIPENSINDSTYDDDVSLGDIDLSDIDDDEFEELSEDDVHPSIRITRVSDPPLSDTHFDGHSGSDLSEDVRRQTLKVPSELNSSQFDDEIVDDDELLDEEFSIGSDLDESISGSIVLDDVSEIASTEAVNKSTPEESVLFEDEPAKKKNSIFGKIRRSIRSVLNRESKEMKEMDGTFEERNGMLFKAQRQSCSIQ